MKMRELSRLLVFMVSLMTAWGTEESSRRGELDLARRQMALLRRLYERNPELVRQFLAGPRRFYGLRQLITNPEFNPYGEQWWELLNDDPSFSPDDFPLLVDGRGFHESIFDEGFGSFSPTARLKREVADAENGHLMKKRSSASRLGYLPPRIYWPVRGKRGKRSAEDPQLDSLIQSLEEDRDEKEKRFGGNAFHGTNAFTGGFGEFATMKKRFGGNAFHGTNAFTGGFGDFSTMKKRFGGNAFHGTNAFTGGFGDFSTMKKRFGGNAFHDTNAFTGGFGDFSTMKRAENEENPSNK
ncbi:unnamed protein product [Darwinula stevensoni]|uniref:Uncharacterized protein n=1 Tax=Darwinula stevensoni TaxID=69355 RepID=A0A7R9AAR0_9CRUS|nr:unnamed protein product [Darwinula stevensoni]CAG0898474.1 unnamed protein product [Darwinula stevensoni]